MRQFIDFLKKHILLILSLLIAPMIVITLFAVLEYGFHKIDMSAGEWSGLLGAAFGYWGTILLGLLAFWQNAQVHEVNTRLLEIEEADRKFKNKPYVVLTECIVQVGFRKKENILQPKEDTKRKNTYEVVLDYDESDNNFKPMSVVLTAKNKSNAEIKHLEYRYWDHTGERLRQLDPIDENADFEISIIPVILAEGDFTHAIILDYCNIYDHYYKDALFIYYRDHSKTISITHSKDTHIN